MITMRWDEYCYYSPEHDMEVCRLMAVTSKGTWYTDVDANEGLLANKRMFKERALDLISRGAEPDYIDLESEHEDG